MNRFRPLIRVGLRLIGPALLLYFLLTTDLTVVWRTLLDTQPWLLLLSLILVVPFTLLKALRWQLILRAWRIELPLRDAIGLYCIGLFLGLVTPGQAGDAVKAWYLRERGHPLSIGLASVVVDRMFDLGLTALIATTGLYFFWHILPGGQLINVIIIAGVFVTVLLGLGLIMHQRLRSFVLGQVLPRVTPSALRDRLGTHVLEALHLTPRQFAVITGVSAAGLAWTYIRVYLVFLALDTPIPIGPFLALVAILAIVSPISPGGVGTRDALLVLVLVTLLDIGSEQAVVRALSLSTLLLVLNLENVLIGFLYSLRYPLTKVPQQSLTERVATLSYGTGES